ERGATTQAADEARPEELSTEQGRPGEHGLVRALVDADHGFLLDVRQGAEALRARDARRTGQLGPSAGALDGRDARRLAGRRLVRDRVGALLDGHGAASSMLAVLRPVR